MEFQKTKALAERGDAEAQFNQGLMYGFRLWVAVRSVALSLLGLACLQATAASRNLDNRITPADPVAAGRELVARLLSQRPAESATNEAVLTVRRGRKKVEVPLRIEVQTGASSWSTTYRTQGPNKDHAAAFTVKHTPNAPNEYRVLLFSRPPGATNEFEILAGEQAYIPFAGSDFWLADLGMEFLQWPTQNLLTKQLCRSRSCNKLESVAPSEHHGGYVRVVSWFDREADAPVLIQAYNAAGKMVKEFKLNLLQKVRGNYQLEEMQMEDLRADSLTVLRFHLDTD